jgi:hypothetical protein
MKLSAALVSAILAGSTVAASHQKHRHFHEKKRDVNAEGHYVETKTVLMYSYNGKTMDEATLCKGLEDGTVQWVGNDPPRPECNKSAPVAKPDHAAKVDSGVFHQKPSHSSSAAKQSHPVPPKPSAPKPSSSDDSDSGAHDLENSNTDKEFPDGEIDCSTFPSDYGAVPVPWAGYGKWSGIQHAQMSGNAVSHLATADKGKGCQPGPDGSDAFCSYACPAGFQKSQWPQNQGGAGYAVSVGGLRCGSDNKLYLTNAGLSKKLCTPGTGDLTISNKLGKGAAVCRTDYPG